MQGSMHIVDVGSPEFVYSWNISEYELFYSLFV